MHFLPYIGKAKMRLRDYRFFFQFSNICLHFPAVRFKIFPKNLPPHKRILDLPTYSKKCIVLEVAICVTLYIESVSEALNSLNLLVKKPRPQ